VLFHYTYQSTYLPYLPSDVNCLDSKYSRHVDQGQGLQPQDVQLPDLCRASGQGVEGKALRFYETIYGCMTGRTGQVLHWMRISYTFLTCSSLSFLGFSLGFQVAQRLVSSRTQDSLLAGNVILFDPRYLSTNISRLHWLISLRCSDRHPTRSEYLSKPCGSRPSILPVQWKKWLVE